jgi:hypothetical protein
MVVQNGAERKMGVRKIPQPRFGPVEGVIQRHYWSSCPAATSRSVILDRAVFVLVEHSPGQANLKGDTMMTTMLSQGGIPAGEPASADIVVEAFVGIAIPTTTPVGTVVLVAPLAGTAIWCSRWRV